VTFPLVARDGCPPEVAALAHGLVAIIDDIVAAEYGTAVKGPAANAGELLAAQDALHTAGWDLHGPTYNVPGGALSWEVVPISRVATS
jgi:hypothetical protein